jgi:hypothetical protein
MDFLKRLKLFPDNWVRKMTPRELEDARQQLKAYTTNVALDLSLREVSKTFSKIRKLFCKGAWYKPKKVGKPLRKDRRARAGD